VANDFEILMHAYQHENDPRNKKPTGPGWERVGSSSWEYYHVGAKSDDVKRLVDEGLVEVSYKAGNRTWHRLTEKGRQLIWAQTMEQKMEVIPAKTIIEAMDLIVGFDDVKEAIGSSIEAIENRRIHYLLSGPPACAKSLMLEAVRQTVPTAYIAFGSRTSSAGLSEILFEHQPTILLLDELDKLRMDTYSVLLGLMESGEILESKIGKTRGIKLKTMVIAAANKTDKMPPELLSRFALHVAFPKYKRDEFIDVVRGYLSRSEKCPIEIAELIGQMVFDYALGDVRKARGVWGLMKEPTETEVRRVVQFMQKYSPDAAEHKNHIAQQHGRMF
jgi:Holliday junction DNA helicase RuvB